MADLLLVGGTGQLGGRIAERLAARGVPIRALVRPASDAGRLAALGAEVVRGDLTDPASLGTAVRRTTTVVTTANAITRMLEGEKGLSIDAVDRHGNEALIRAAEAAGVQRFVFVAGFHDLPGMVERSPFTAAKTHVEQVLRGSPMPSVTVRPGPFQDFWISRESGIVPERRLAVLFGRGRTPMPYVAVDDVAEAVVRLTLAASPPAVVDFAGPERLTRHQVVDVFERATGVRFRRLSIPRSALATGCRLLRRRKPAIASVLGMALASDETEVPLDAGPLRDLGIEPRSTTQAVEQLVRERSRA